MISTEIKETRKIHSNDVWSGKESPDVSIKKSFENFYG